MPRDSVAPAADTPLPWLASFATGDLRIDGEHQALIEVVNDLCTLARRTPSASDMRDAARELIAVVEAHFESEERLFPAIAYPAHRAHVREHLSILAALDCLLLRDATMAPPVAAATARLLLIEHLLRHDLSFKTWVEVSGEH